MWIQEWVDERFGVPNTVNIQVYEDFAKEVEGRGYSISTIVDVGNDAFGDGRVYERKRIVSELEELNAHKIVEGHPVLGFVVGWQALKGESNE